MALCARWTCLRPCGIREIWAVFIGSLGNGPRPLLRVSMQTCLRSGALNPGIWQRAFSLPGKVWSCNSELPLPLAQVSARPHGVAALPRVPEHFPCCLPSLARRVPGRDASSRVAGRISFPCEIRPGPMFPGPPGTGQPWRYPFLVPQAWPPPQVIAMPGPARARFLSTDRPFPAMRAVLLLVPALDRFPDVPRHLRRTLIVRPSFAVLGNHSGTFLMGTQQGDLDQPKHPRLILFAPT
jgi:hypothetical protein